VSRLTSRPEFSAQTLSVLAALCDQPSQWQHGYALARQTGLKSGTLYPILMRLAEHQMLKTSWEATETGRPPRHMYKLTNDGLRYAREQVSAAPSLAAGQPVLGGVTA